MSPTALISRLSYARAALNVPTRLHMRCQFTSANWNRGRLDNSVHCPRNFSSDEDSSKVLPQYDNVLSKLATLPPWSAENESALLGPFSYITSNPGKNVRGRLFNALNLWLDVPAPKLAVICRVVDMLHNATLLLDDIQDNSQTRRGKPVAHKIYGVPQTINTVGHVFCLAYQELFALRENPSESDLSERAMGIVTEEFLSLYRGQGLEILWRDSLRCPTEEEYISMVNDKAGALLRMGVRLMMAYSTQNLDVAYVPLVNLMAISFQILDDLVDLQSKEDAHTEEFAEDLTEGNFCFPIVHGIHADTTNQYILNVLKQRPTDPTLKNHTVEYLRNHTRSFQYTQEVLANLEKQMREEIQRLGGNEELENILDYLSVGRAVN